MGVQQVVGFFSERFFQKLIVERFDLGIGMGFPELFAGVFLVNGVDAGLADRVVGGCPPPPMQPPGQVMISMKW